MEEIKDLMKKNNIPEGTIKYVQEVSSEIPFDPLTYDTIYSVKQVNKIKKNMQYFPSDDNDWTILKGRFKNGNLEILLKNPQCDENNIWVNLSLHPNCENLSDAILSGKLSIKISGSNN